MSDSPHNHCPSLPSQPLAVADAPLVCATCNAPLCLRKQVINLALGNVEVMHCLTCLGAENEQLPQLLLSDLMSYINQRDCFKKEWQRYLSVDYCPDRDTCFPAVCFPAQKP